MIYVGTCGFSYKDWVGPWYPGTIRKEEMLPYYARCFRAVEIDASFYGTLRPAAIAPMNRETPAEFRFCFKAPQSVTHAAERPDSFVHPDAGEFLRSVTPLLESGKFGVALLQFPTSFKPAQNTRTYLRRVCEVLDPLPLVAEFRSREWQTPQTLELLGDLGVGWCNVDMPHYDALMLPSSDVTSARGYVRFHGRNAGTWWTGDNTTRYDYLYSEQELVPWADRVAEIDEQASVTYAFFNNHARGNATRNAEMFIDLLRERYGEAADAFIAARSRQPSQGNLFDS
jgi:uncharacterized protein YecE (DUF72 family)